jgi:hypothetical protein
MIFILTNIKTIKIMIAPEFRNCQVFNLKDNAKDFIETNHGHDLYATLVPSLNEIDDIKKELLGA